MNLTYKLVTTTLVFNMLVTLKMQELQCLAADACLYGFARSHAINGNDD